MRQKFGQNFLTNNNIARNIVMAANPCPEDVFVEIGPGKGALTRIIAPLVKTLTAVELDPKLAAKLKLQFANCSNVRIMQGDFLDLCSEVISRSPSQVKIIGNLPYNVATAVIGKFLPEQNWHTAVVMVQKEAAERMTALPRTKEYGYFSIFCQHYASAKILFTVAPESFSPRPKITSSVIELTNKRPLAIPENLFWVIKGLFSQRRKTVLNSLSNLLNKPKIGLMTALENAGIDPMARPETLNFEQFETLTSLVQKDIIFRQENSNKIINDK